MNYLSTIKEFVRAEESGNWQGHLAAMGKILNLFAATGLIMSKVGGFTFNLCWIWKKITHSSIISLMKKDFTVQTDEFWAGLWTDLVIEQTMMCSFKSLGGLTRGQGMDESTRNIWISTLHNRAAVEETMCQVTKTTGKNNEQHVELGQSRCMRDFEDLIKFYTWLKQFNKSVAEAKAETSKKAKILLTLTKGVQQFENTTIHVDRTNREGN